MAVQGERIGGGFILLIGIDGIRYAVRQQSVGVILDADECRDETIVQLHGGHVVRVPCSMDEAGMVRVGRAPANVLSISTSKAWERTANPPILSQRCLVYLHDITNTYPFLFIIA
jgi:hypothetical protein